MSKSNNKKIDYKEKNKINSLKFNQIQKKLKMK